MSPAYKQQLRDAYQGDKKWKKVIKMLTEERERLREERAEESQVLKEVTLKGINFSLNNDLIYYRDVNDDRERLCVPKTLEKAIFQQAHDLHSHLKFQRTYEKIAGTYYMRHLTRRLKRYLLHCPECQLNQTKRHRPYGALQPIESPPRCHHTVVIDFVVELPVTRDGENSLLTVTNKFSKRITMAAGKDTYKAEDWAKILLTLLVDWGIPKVIISDRDPKFLSNLWQAMFKELGTELHLTTAYHPQADGQSERTNQTVEIALRYYITSNPTKAERWNEFLPFLRATLNNAFNAATGMSPNELVYGTKLNEGVSMLANLKGLQTDIGIQRNLNQKAAAEAIAFANVDAKTRYDTKHQPLRLKEGDFAFVKLHAGYKLSGLENSKLTNQRAGPFKVLKRYGQLVYKLELPQGWKIYPVLSVAMLESAPKERDPYKRPREEGLNPVLETKEQKELGDTYEIEELLDRKEIGKGSRKKIKFLVKWREWGPVHNKWYDIADLGDAREAITDYERKYEKRSRREYEKVRGISETS